MRAIRVIGVICVLAAVGMAQLEPPGAAKPAEPSATPVANCKVGETYSSIDNSCRPGTIPIPSAPTAKLEEQEPMPPHRRHGRGPPEELPPTAHAPPTLPPVARPATPAFPATPAVPAAPPARPQPPTFARPPLIPAQPAAPAIPVAPAAPTAAPTAPAPAPQTTTTTTTTIPTRPRPVPLPPILTPRVRCPLTFRFDWYSRSCVGTSFAVALSCPSGSVYDASLRRCVIALAPSILETQCPGGTVFDVVARRCVTAPAPSPVCPQDYEYDARLGNCVSVTQAVAGTGTANRCPAGYQLDVVANNCVSIVAPNPEAEELCPDGYDLDAATNTCKRRRTRPNVEAEWTCPTGWLYDSTSQQCVQQQVSLPPTTTTAITPIPTTIPTTTVVVPGGCPIGSFYSPRLGQCVMSRGFGGACPVGTVWTGWRCRPVFLRGPLRGEAETQPLTEQGETTAEESQKRKRGVGIILPEAKAEDWQSKADASLRELELKEPAVDNNLYVSPYGVFKGDGEYVGFFADEPRTAQLNMEAMGPSSRADQDRFAQPPARRATPEERPPKSGRPVEIVPVSESDTTTDRSTAESSPRGRTAPAKSTEIVAVSDSEATDRS